MTLVGDHIENPANALTLAHAAAMFGSPCLFHESHDRESPDRLDPSAEGGRIGGPSITRDELAAGYVPIVACDNVEGAVDVYSFRLPAGPQPALVVGNERHGIAANVARLARAAVEIPMQSHRVNTLNVAAAAAVAIYYLSRGQGARMPVYRAPERRRPELLLVGGSDHVELGSTIRSAGAFGWRRLFLEDPEAVWFGSSRGTRTEGRAAARSAKNPIKLIPFRRGPSPMFDEAVVVSHRVLGGSLHRTSLAAGPRQLLVLADESRLEVECEDWSRLARTVRFAHLDLPARDFAYHYRLVASIALAESARQIGRASAQRPEGRRRYPTYDSATLLLDEAEGEIVDLDDFVDY